MVKIEFSGETIDNKEVLSVDSTIGKFYVEDRETGMVYILKPVPRCQTPHCGVWVDGRMNGNKRTKCKQHDKE